MLFDGEARWTESRDRVAFLAVAAPDAIGEFALVPVGMTVAAGLELQPPLGLSRQMTLVAGDLLVTAFQRIPRLTVVKTNGCAHRPAGCVVASFATQSETPLVGVLVAFVTILMTNLGKL